MLELAAIVVLGILAQWLAWKTKVPAILPLIIIGLLVGPLSTYFTADGCKWIQPRISLGCDNYLFHGDLLFYFVSLAIGIILFEGGLTLKRKEIAGVGPSIIKLITLGSLITFVGAGVIVHYLMQLSWSLSFLFAGLIIVTGPTVIAPILRNIPLTPNVSTVLKWEGILIDPIGALVAVLVFEFIVSGEGTGSFTIHALKSFVTIVLMGSALGSLAAYGLYQVIKNNWVPHYLLNVLTLAMVVLVFVLSDLLEHESGLLSVVVMGMVMGNLDVPKLREILDFKESLSVLLISILFILLSANIDISQLQLLLNWKSLVLFGLVMLVLRPLGVFLSTRGSNLSFNEKAFISWVGPRGIVAAGVASLFGIKLTDRGIPGAEFITPLVFLIVLGSVLLNATTARYIAKALKVVQDKANGILIIGANDIGRALGKFLKDHGLKVVLLDSNASHIKMCHDLGIGAIQANIYTDDLSAEIELVEMGYLIALTGNDHVNSYSLNRFGKEYGENGSVRLISPKELRKKDATANATLPLISDTDDYINMSEALRDYPFVWELEVDGAEDLQAKYAALTSKDSNTVPILFIKEEGSVAFIPKTMANGDQDEVKTIVYFGEKLGAE